MHKDGRQQTAGWVLALTAMASFMVALDTLVVSTALTTIRLDLDASIEELEWTINSYNLSFAVLLMTAAALGDRFGRRRMFMAGLGLFVVSSAACAVAPSIGTLIAARAVQGVGAAMVTTLALALVSSAFAPERRGAALGIFFAVTGLAVASGPFVGGAIAEGLSWSWIFWLNVPLGLVLIPLVRARIEEAHGPDTRLDIPGLALVTGAAFGVVWGLVRSNAAGWASFEVVASIAGGLILAVGFVRWELHTNDPMLPMRFFRSRAFSAGNTSVFFTVAALFTGVFFLAQFLQTGLGYGPMGAGLRLLPWTATLFFVAPVAGALVDRYGERPFMTGGLLLQAAGLAWIAAIADPGMSYSEMIAPLMVAGVGVSMAFPAAQNSVVGAVPEEAIGKAAGTNSTMRELGGVFGIALAVAVFSGSGDFSSPEAFTDGFVPALTVGATLSLIGAAAGLALPGRRLAPAIAEPAR